MILAVNMLTLFSSENSCISLSIFRSKQRISLFLFFFLDEAFIISFFLSLPRITEEMGTCSFVRNVIRAFSDPSVDAVIKTPSSTVFWLVTDEISSQVS